MRKDILERKVEILDWISENQSKAYMCKELLCKPSTLESWLIKMDIRYDGNRGGKGIKKDPKRLTALEYIKSTYVKSHLLRLKLIEDGHKEHKCEGCNSTKWLKKLIPLELHHVDGNHYNNTLSNLLILCPNCHAQTDNYRKRKRK